MTKRYYFDMKQPETTKLNESSSHFVLTIVSFLFYTILYQ